MPAARRRSPWPIAICKPVDLIAAFLVFAGVMALSLILDFSMLLALAVGLACFCAVALHRGFAPRRIGKMVWQGAAGSLVVLRVFLLIGLITAMWRASGTLAFFVVWGTRLITPRIFLLLTFLLTSLLSFALGTSYGVTGTAGVILITLARSGGVDPVMTAGAILSGAYFGDRCAPASSCANLVAGVTGTQLYDNVKHMLRSAALPFLLCVGIYGVLSVCNPIAVTDTALLAGMETQFALSWWTVIPAVLMLVLPLCKVKVRWVLLSSILSAMLIAVVVQGMPVLIAVKTALGGYAAPAGLELLSGGGLVSMLKVAGIVVLSSTYSGLFQGTGMLGGVQQLLERGADKLGLFPMTSLVSVGVCAVFCNQTIGVMMVNQLMEGVYHKREQSADQLSLDISNSVVVIAGLVPWCIASAVPLSMLNISAAALPYACLLYLIPLCYGVTRRRYWQGKAPVLTKT